MKIEDIKVGQEVKIKQPKDREKVIASCSIPKRLKDNVFVIVEIELRCREGLPILIEDKTGSFGQWVPFSWLIFLEELKPEVEERKWWYNGGLVEVVYTFDDEWVMIIYEDKDFDKVRKNELTPISAQVAELRGDIAALQQELNSLTN